MNPRRVLFVHRWGVTLAGGERWLAEMAEHLDRARFVPIVVLHRLGPLSDLLSRMAVRVIPADVDCLRVKPRHAMVTSAVRVLIGAVRLAGIVRSTRARLLHAFSPDAAEAAYIAGVLTGTPVVVTVQNPVAIPLLDGLILRRVAAVIAISRAVAHDVLAAGVAPEKVFVIPPGVRTASFVRGDAAAARQSLGVPPGAPLVGVIGHLEPKKAQDVFVRAAGQVAAAYPDARFVLVGADKLGLPGQPSAYLRQLDAITAELALGDRMVFAGYRTDVPDILAALDVVAMPSRHEGLGLVAVEAMAAGKALVAAAVEGLLEVVEPDVTGLLVPADDPSALAAAIMDLLSDPKRRTSLGERARMAARSYDSRALVARNQDLYDRVIADARAR